jgi:hypothetical protein
MKSLIIILTCLTLCSSANSQDISNTQQALLKAVEEKAAGQREKIETQHADQLNELRELAKKEAREFSQETRIFWIKYIQKELSCTEIYFTPPHSHLLQIETHRKFRKEITDSYYVNDMADLLLNKNAKKILTQIEKGGYETLFLRWEAGKLLNIIKILEHEQQYIENHYTTAITQLENWEKEQIKNISQVKQKTETDKPQVGVVSGIAYGAKPAIMIEGVDKPIVYQGQTVNNIKVVKIYPDRVKFRKGLKSWVQKVGTPADITWKSF